MRQHVPPQQLWNEFHGDLDFEYDHAVYWPAMLKLCEEKHAEQRERWVKAGKHYGESEDYLKGGTTPSIGASLVETVSKNETEGKDETVEKTETVSAKADEAGEEKAPIQTTASPASGNTEAVAATPDPVSTSKESES
jgi:hypothetical protein